MLQAPCSTPRQTRGHLQDARGIRTRFQDPRLPADHQFRTGDDSVTTTAVQDAGGSARRNWTRWRLSTLSRGPKAIARVRTETHMKKPDKPRSERGDPVESSLPVRTLHSLVLGLIVLVANLGCTCATAPSRLQTPSSGQAPAGRDHRGASTKNDPVAIHKDVASKEDFDSDLRSCEPEVTRELGYVYVLTIEGRKAGPAITVRAYRDAMLRRGYKVVPIEGAAHWECLTLGPSVELR